MTRKQKIAALERRRNFLARRISESDKDLTWDRRELAAITWVIAELERAKNRGER